VLAPVDAMGALTAGGSLTDQGGPVVDIDNDGVYETITNAGGGIAIRKKGAILPGWPLDLGGVPTISDLDRDGRLDILFLSGKNNSLNCYSLGSGSYDDRRILTYGTVDGIGRGAYPTFGRDPFEPNHKAFTPETTTTPVASSRAFRISALRDTFSSGGGWSRRLRALLGHEGDRDVYWLQGGIINVTLTSPVGRDYDVYVHMYRPDGTFLATWSATGTGATDNVNCHSTTGCPESGTNKTFLIEVRAKDPATGFGPLPYILQTSWAN
jgi:hypothetical protein